MGRKKKLPKIEVHSVANGYMLTIEGQKQPYMYFSPEKLMEGVMVHIGLKMTDQLSAETISSFIDSALQWNDLKKSTAEINRLKNQLNNLQRNRNGIATRLMHERDRFMYLLELCKGVTIGKHGLTDAIAKLNAHVGKLHGLKKLTPRELGITSADIEIEEEEVEDDEG